MNELLLMMILLSRSLTLSPPFECHISLSLFPLARVTKRAKKRVRELAAATKPTRSQSDLNDLLQVLLRLRLPFKLSSSSSFTRLPFTSSSSSSSFHPCVAVSLSLSCRSFVSYIYLYIILNASYLPPLNDY